MSAIDRVIAELADCSHGVVATRDLLAAGVSATAIKRRARDGRLTRLHRGVYAVGHAELPRQGRWMAAVLACGPEGVLGIHDAAALHDLRLSARSSIDVIVPGVRRRSTKAITVHRHRLALDEITILDGIPVTTVARTLLDLAGAIGSTAMRRAYERAEELRKLDCRQVDAVLGRANGHRGSGALRALLGYDPTPAINALSELERMFCDLVHEAGLPAPLTNVLVDGYLVDAYWPRARLVVELQGYEHHHRREAFERDHAKQADLKAAGFEVLVFTYRQVVEQPERVAEVVGTILARRWEAEVGSG